MDRREIAGKVNTQMNAYSLDMEPDKDRLLLLDLINGKEGAFRRIYETYWEDLYTFAAHILNRESEVEDIVQEVFVKLWRIKDGLHHLNSLKAYLLTMTKNSVIQYLAKKKKQGIYSDILREYLPSADQDPEQKMIVNQMSTIIDAEIGALPPRMQQIFVLSRKNQLSHKEIAKILEISDQTVRKQISNSLRYLKNRLKYLI